MSQVHHIPEDRHWTDLVSSALSPYSPTHRELGAFTETLSHVSIPTFGKIGLSSSWPSLEMSIHSRTEMNITYIRLSEVSMFWPVLVGKGLLITQDYLAIRDWIERDERDCLEVGTCTRGLAIVGTSGIGKSCFLLYLLLLRVSQGQETIFKSSTSKTFWFHDGVVERQSEDDLLERLSTIAKERRRTIFALFDGSNPSLDWIPIGCRIIQATESQTRYDRWTKRFNAQLCFVDTWSWPDFASLSYVNDEENCLQKLWILFSRYGGVPRNFDTIARRRRRSAIFYENLESHELAIIQRVRRLVCEGTACNAVQRLIESDSDLLIVARPPSIKDMDSERVLPEFIDAPFIPDHYFATQYITDIVAVAYIMKLDTRSFEFYSKIYEAPDFQVPARKIFESMVLDVLERHTIHDIMSADGLRTLVDPSSGSSIIHLNEFKKASQVIDLANISQLRDYIYENDDKEHVFFHLPQSRNSTNINAMYITNDAVPVLLLATMSKRHPINAEELDEIWQQLPARLQEVNLNLVFITPDLYMSGFQKQSYEPESSGNIWSKRVIQSHIRISHKKLHEVWSRLPHSWL